MLAYHIGKWQVEAVQKTHISAIKKDKVEENNDYLRLESKINLQIAIIDNVMEELQTLKSSKIYNLLYLRNLAYFYVWINFLI